MDKLRRAASNRIFYTSSYVRVTMYASDLGWQNASKHSANLHMFSIKLLRLCDYLREWGTERERERQRERVGSDRYLDIYPRGYFRETLVMFSFFPRAENAAGLIGLHSENRWALARARARTHARFAAATLVKIVAIGDRDRPIFIFSRASLACV